METKKKIGFGTILKLLVCAICKDCVSGVCYLVSNYYVLMQDTYQLTATQMGSMQSIIGVCAVIGNFFGGILCDYINPRKLLIFSAAVACAGGLFYLTMPGYQMLLIAYWIVGIGTSLPFYCALPKFMATFVDRKAHGTLWGIYCALASAFSFLVGMMTSAIIAASSSKAGFRSLLLFYIVESALTMLFLVLMREKQTEKKTVKPGKKESFSWRMLLDVLREPDVWLIAVSSACLYNCLIGHTYISSMLKNQFLASVAVTTMIATVGNYGFRMIGGTFFGMLVDKITARKTQLYMIVLYMCIMAVFLFLPSDAKYLTVVVILNLLAVLAFRVAGQSMNPILSQTEYHIPFAVRGTAYAIVATLESIPDIFAYVLAGRAIDRYGYTGYKLVFGVLLAWQCVGFACLIALGKRAHKPGVLTGLTIDDYQTQQKEENA